MSPTIGTLQVRPRVSSISQFADCMRRQMGGGGGCQAAGTGGVVGATGAGAGAVICLGRNKDL